MSRQETAWRRLHEVGAVPFLPCLSAPASNPAPLLGPCLPHVDLARHRRRDQGGAVFLEPVDTLLNLGDEAFDFGMFLGPRNNDCSLFFNLGKGNKTIVVNLVISGSDDLIVRCDKVLVKSSFPYEQK